MIINGHEKNFKRNCNVCNIRQDSKVSEELTERDPYNKLYARGARVRLSAEQVRDQALAISGLLSKKMYGPV